MILELDCTLEVHCLMQDTRVALLLPALVLLFLCTSKADTKWEDIHFEVKD